VSVVFVTITIWLLKGDISSLDLTAACNHRDRSPHAMLGIALNHPGKRFHRDHAAKRRLPPRHLVASCIRAVRSHVIYLFVGAGQPGRAAHRQRFHDGRPGSSSLDNFYLLLLLGAVFYADVVRPGFKTACSREIGVRIALGCVEGQRCAIDMDQIPEPSAWYHHAD
jgi:hypothetical protein